MNQPMPERADAAGVLLRDHIDRFLLVKSPYKSHWDLPGGMVDPGESAVQAAFREVTEELGIVLVHLRTLVADCLNATPSRPYGVRWVFDGGIISSCLPFTVQPDEIEATRWVYRSQLAELTATAPMLQRRIRCAINCAMSHAEALMVDGSFRRAYPAGQLPGLIDEPAYLTRTVVSTTS